MIAYIVSQRLFARCHFKGGGSSSSMTSQNTTNNTYNVESYKPSEAELRLAKQQADFADKTMPNAYYLNDLGKALLENSLGAVQVNFNDMNNTAQRQIANAQANNQSLMQGNLPAVYQRNMENSVRQGVNNTMGQYVNDLVQRGVLNSSVANKVFDDANSNLTNTLANSYTSNLAMLENMNNNAIANAGQPVALGASAQESAQNPALRVWNASLGLSQPTSTAYQMVAGQGTKTSQGMSNSQSNSTTNSSWKNNSNLFGSVLGAGVGALGAGMGNAIGGRITNQMFGHS